MPREARSLIETSPISSSSFAVIFGNRLRIRDDIAQRSEQLAIGSGLPARGALLARLARERTQALGVDARVGVDQRADRAVVLQQFLAPALDPVNSRGLFGRDPVPGPQLLSDRFRIYVAHKPADVLQLSPPRLVLGDASRPLDRVLQVFRQRDRSELLRIEPDQALAKGLQLVHGAFARGLAGLFLGVHVPGREVVS